MDDDGNDTPTGDTDDDSLTYADAGVDIDKSEAATAALVAATGAGDASGGETSDGTTGPAGDYAGLIEAGEGYLGLATDGVGTKLLVAEALGDYSTVGIDCVAMNANDLVAAGVEPTAFVDYLAVEEPGEDVAEQIGEGLAVGAERAGVALLGGETAVMPEVIRELDLAGTCAGFATDEQLFDGTARAGDALVGWAATGIHSNGLTLARQAVTREHEYTDPCPFGDYDTLGAALLEPTRIYTDLLAPMRDHDVRAAAHITGGGWRNLERLGSHHYRVTDPWPTKPVFEFVQEVGGVSDAEMHRTFNMGTGFVAAVDPGRADELAGATGGRVIGRVERGDGETGDDDTAGSETATVSIRGVEL
jgi:phosphoribosylformylglycinamidine cyclo-ligase